MAMKKRSSVTLAVGVLAFVGGLVGASEVSSWQLSVALAVGGTVALFGSITVVHFVFDDNTVWWLVPDDERTQQIEFHAARNTFVVLLVLVNALLFSLAYLPWSAEADVVLLGVQFAGLGTFWTSFQWYKRRM